MPEVYESIDKLFALPWYATRAAWRAAYGGQEPPPWNPDLPPKYWEDPEAKESLNAQGFPILEEHVVYPLGIRQTKTGGPVLDAQGYPIVGQFYMPVSEARTVNLPTEPVADQSQPIKPMKPIPLKPLAPNQRLELRPHPMSGTQVVIRNLDVPIPGQNPTNAPPASLDALQAEIRVVRQILTKLALASGVDLS